MVAATTPLLSAMTLYVVVVRGEATTMSPVVELSPVEGLQA